MKRADIAKLWRDIDTVGSAKAGRTEWTTGGGIWIVRSRALGDNLPKRRLDHSATFAGYGNRRLQAELARFTKDARRCSRTDGDRVWNERTERMAILHNANGLLSSSSIRVAFHLDRFAGLCLLANEFTNGQWEHRVDPYIRVASWWTIGANPYPFAILAGFYGGSLVLDGEATS